MNHGFRTRYIMSQEDMVAAKNYVVEVTSNEGKSKKHITDCYQNALYEVMCLMNPSVHMIVIKDVDDNSFNGGYQRWDREREVYGNEWHECDVDELIVLGPIREVNVMGTVDDLGIITPSPYAKNSNKHHWWGLARHIERYIHFTETDPEESKLDNDDLLIRLNEIKSLAVVLAEIADHKISKGQKPSIEFIKAGKNSKVHLFQVLSYINQDHSDDPEYEVLIKKLGGVIDSIHSATKEGITNEYTRNQAFNLVWACIQNQWRDLVLF